MHTKLTFTVPLVGGGRGSGQRAPECVEPLCWHNFKKDFYTELLHSYYAKFVIDLTPGAGGFAACCLDEGVGYLGICFPGEDHKVALLDRLADICLEQMRTEAVRVVFPCAHGFDPRTFLSSSDNGGGREGGEYTQ